MKMVLPKTMFCWKVGDFLEQIFRAKIFLNIQKWLCFWTFRNYVNQKEKKTRTEPHRPDTGSTGRGTRPLIGRSGQGDPSVDSGQPWMCTDLDLKGNHLHNKEHVNQLITWCLNTSVLDFEEEIVLKFPYPFHMTFLLPNTSVLRCGVYTCWFPK